LLAAEVQVTKIIFDFGFDLILFLCMFPRFVRVCGVAEFDATVHVHVGVCIIRFLYQVIVFVCVFVVKDIVD